MAHEIFISYAQEDKPMANALCATLEKNGLRCWIAPRDVPPGNWGAAIVDAIESSRVFVLVFSQHSNRSQHVCREVERAVSKGLMIVPVRLEEAPLSKEMQYFISSTHWLDALTPPLERHFEDLATKLKTWLGPTTNAAPTPPPEPAPSRSTPERLRLLKFTAVKWALGGALLLLGIALGVFLFNRSGGTGSKQDEAKQDAKTPPARPNVTNNPQRQVTGTVFSTKPSLLPMRKPTIEAGPTDQKLKEGSPLVLEARVSGDEPVRCEWQFKTGADSWANLAGQTDATLRIANVRRAHSGNYRLLATNAAGAATSPEFRVTVQPWEPPKILADLTDLAVKEGTSALLRTSVAGEGELSVRWQFRRNELQTWTAIPDTEGDRLTWSKMTDQQQGFYRFIVSNQGGAVTSAVARVTLIPPTPPVITQNPQKVQLTEGEAAQLTAKVTTEATPTYDWQFSADSGVHWQSLPAPSVPTLDLRNATLAMSGLYRLLVRSTAGAATSEVAQVTVLKRLPVLGFTLTGPPATAREALLVVYTNLHSRLDAQLKQDMNWRLIPIANALDLTSMLSADDVLELTVGNLEPRIVDLGPLQARQGEKINLRADLQYYFTFRVKRGGKVLWVDEAVNGTIQGMTFERIAERSWRQPRGGNMYMKNSPFSPNTPDSMALIDAGYLPYDALYDKWIEIVYGRLKLLKR